MNSRTTLALTLLAILFTGFAWWDAGRSEFHFQRDLDQPFRFPESSIESITMRTEKVAARVVAAGGSWNIVEPIEFPAEHTSIEAITHLVHEIRVRGEGAGKRGTGLEESKVQLDLGVVGRSTIELRLGSAHPTLPYVYAAIDDEIVLIDPALREALLALTLDDLRRTAICDVPLARVERLTIERGEERFTVRSRPTGWTMTEPSIGDADGPSVVDALGALNSWGVHSFIADAVSDPAELAQYGLSPPRGRIEVEERGTGRTVAIRFGNPIELPGGGGAGVFLYLESTRCVVRATAALFARLPATSEEWESRLLVRIPARDVVAATLLGDYRRVELTNDGRGGWRVTWSADGIPQPAEAPLVVTMIESLRGAVVEEFIPKDDRNLQLYGFDRPLLDLELRRASGESERILVGREVPESPGMHYVWNFSWARYAIAVFPDLGRWQRAPFTLRSLDVVTIPADALLRVRVSDDRSRRTWVKGNRGWQPIGDRADLPTHVTDEAVNAALDSLASLRADRWDPGPPDPPGPDRSRLLVEVLPLEPFDAEPWLRLWVGPRAGDDRWLRVGDDGGLVLLRRYEGDDPFLTLEAALTDRP